MATLTVWTLNQATHLIHGEEARIVDALEDGGRHAVRFGNRDGSHALMHEGDYFGGPKTDEYFVPIPLKCLGHRHSETPPGQPGLILGGIRKEHEWFFGSQEAFEAYWSPRQGPLGNVQMSTPGFRGYYELLPPGGNNVLIGYSQGGLVARYLAFLDEHVFGENRIAAVITLHSPNHGSPLAFDTLPTLPASKERIADGLLQAVQTIASFHRNLFPRLHTHVSKLGFDSLYRVISELFEDLEARKERLNKDERSLHQTTGSALKWLSGLQPLPFATAFNDLNPGTYARPFSVLSLLNRFPPRRILTGAVVGANGQLSDMAKSILGGFFSGLLLQFVKPFGRDLAGNLAIASRVYAEKVLAEAYAGVEVPALIRAYELGITLSDGQKLAPFAHDFVVPAVSQVLPGASLGNLLNLEANHDSGKDRVEGPGRTNAGHIRTLLKRAARLIPTTGTVASLPAPGQPGFSPGIAVG